MNKRKPTLWPTLLLFSTYLGFIFPLMSQGVQKSPISHSDSSGQLSNEYYKDPFSKPFEVVNAAHTLNVSTEQSQEKKKRLLLETMFLELKYAAAENVTKLIMQNGSQLLSEHGSLSFDERTNIIIVRDTPISLKNIEAMVQRIDVPVKQVQIEARIVILNEGGAEEMGVRWGVLSKNNSVNIGGSIEGLYHTNSLEAPSVEKDIKDYLNVNLASPSPNASSVAFQIAMFGSSTLLDLELSALQSESKAEVISNPKLLTMNNKTAYIEQGTEIPYLESSENGVATVKFRKAVLSLEVTPQITSNNKIILDLLVTQDRPGQIVKTGTGEAIAIDTQRINTQVIVSDDETIVLGGIFQRTNINSVDKVPLLADIPLIGELFKRRSESEMKRELLIFVTPKIIQT